MHLDPALADHLAWLSRGLDSPADLAITLEALVASVIATVPSYLGLTVLLHPPTSPPVADVSPVSMTFLQDPDPPAGAGPAIGSSLLLPVRAQSPSSPSAGSEPTTPEWVTQIVLYAKAPGAFVDLAADLSWLEGRPLSSMVVDQHLVAAATDGGRMGEMVGASQTDQALGVLLARGLTPAQAKDELAQRATDWGEDLVSAAARLLRDL
ncbi:MAG: hypothetical protein M3Y71_03925 [Actinomycetota bacterium]|nr:hypothetical protein [Actinomycetota bacterium]